MVQAYAHSGILSSGKPLIQCCIRHAYNIHFNTRTEGKPCETSGMMCCVLHINIALYAAHNAKQCIHCYGGDLILYFKHFCVMYARTRSKTKFNSCGQSLQLHHDALDNRATLQEVLSSPSLQLLLVNYTGIFSCCYCNYLHAVVLSLRSCQIITRHLLNATTRQPVHRVAPLIPV
jgi:hypothetical protein